MANVIATEFVFCILSIAMSFAGAALVPYMGNKLLTKRGLLLAANQDLQIKHAGSQIEQAKQEKLKSEQPSFKMQATQGIQPMQAMQGKTALATFLSRLALFIAYSLMASSAIYDTLLTNSLFMQKALVLWILFMLAFFIMQVALYCDCLCRIIPNDLCMIFFALGIAVSLLQGGFDTLISRFFMAVLALLFLIICNIPSYIKHKNAAFGAGDLKIIPSLLLLVGTSFLIIGILSCCLLAAALGIAFALRKHKLRNVQIPLAPGLLVWLMTQTLLM